MWDPQAARQSLTVEWSSPGMPAWLAWRGDLLEGTPGPGDQAEVDVTIEARVSTLVISRSILRVWWLTPSHLVPKGRSGSDLQHVPSKHCVECGGGHGAKGTTPVSRRG